MILKTPTVSKKELMIVDYFTNNIGKAIIKRCIFSLPFTDAFMQRIHAICNNYFDKKENKRKFLKTLENLNRNEENAQHFGSKYGYEDEVQELVVAAKYQKTLSSFQIQDPSEYSKKVFGVESRKLYAHIIQELSLLFSSDKQITQVVNFGVGYAHIDEHLAVKFPNVKFLGIDRSRLTKCYNEMYFSHLKNMEFYAEDIFSFLSNKRFEGGVFLHIRTLGLLPRSFIEKLYKAVAKAGFRYIVGMEPVGFSRQTLQPYEFSSEQDNASVVFRSSMFLHNYPWLLKNAGYPVSKMDLVKTEHHHKDYRIFSVVASNG